MLPLLQLLLIILPPPYESKSINDCGEGYLSTPVIGHCQPFCNFGCPEYAFCILPDVCNCMDGYELSARNRSCVPVPVKPCQLGYFWTFKTNSCVSICDEAYIWNAESASCEHRCKPGITWDAVTHSCVQKLKANVELIVREEVVQLAGEDATEGAGDGEPEILLDLVGAVGACNTTNCGEESKTTLCLSFFSMLMAFGVATLLVVLVCLGNYLWKRRVNQHVEVLNAKNLSQEEYMLDRSQIMVY